LAHFVLIGAALFIASSLLSTRDEIPRDAIVVSAGKIEHLSAVFEQTWKRPPTRAEQAGLVDDFVREEAAYREGLAIGLDRNDTIVRRRIRQKLDFIAEDVASLAVPSEENLADYLTTNADRFRVEPRFWFQHVALRPEAHAGTLDEDVRELLTLLRTDASAEPADLGDSSLLRPAYGDVSIRDIQDLFGPAFATSIIELETGSWQGPIESAYGIHAVLIDERRAGRLPELSEVRATVRQEWASERRDETIETFYRELLDRYEIVIKWPDDPETQGGDS